MSASATTPAPAAGRATRRSLRALLAALALTLGAPGCADGGGGGHAPSEPFAPGIDVRIALRSNVADIVPVVEVTRRDAIVNGVVATEITSLVDAGGGNYAGRLLFDCDPAVGTRVVLGARVLGYLPASVPPDGEATLHETRSSEFVAESVCATAVHHILTLKLAIVEP
ncbi:MAG: hypothetical protein H6745_04595 [Deltaproteobacteria bacterium]|nr:hypothetical protein [Deltaproteobacteria bacterium]